MLHLGSFNMGKAAGITAKSLNFPRPKELEDIPEFEAIIDKSEPMEMFFPSSYVEGFVSAWDYPDQPFC
jgi:hypothetical protein